MDSKTLDEQDIRVGDRVRVSYEGEYMGGGLLRCDNGAFVHTADHATVELMGCGDEEEPEEEKSAMREPTELASAVVASFMGKRCVLYRLARDDYGWLFRGAESGCESEWLGWWELGDPRPATEEERATGEPGPEPWHTGWVVLRDELGNAPEGVVLRSDPNDLERESRDWRSNGKGALAVRATSLGADEWGGYLPTSRFFQSPHWTFTVVRGVDEF